MINYIEIETARYSTTLIQYGDEVFLPLIFDISNINIDGAFLGDSLRNVSVKIILLNNNNIFYKKTPIQFYGNNIKVGMFIKQKDIFYKKLLFTGFVSQVEWSDAKYILTVSDKVRNIDYFNLPNAIYYSNVTLYSIIRDLFYKQAAISDMYDVCQSEDGLYYNKPIYNKPLSLVLINENKLLPILAKLMYQFMLIGYITSAGALAIRPFRINVALSRIKISKTMIIGDFYLSMNATQVATKVTFEFDYNNKTSKYNRTLIINNSDIEKVIGHELSQKVSLSYLQEESGHEIIGLLTKEMMETYFSPYVIITFTILMEHINFDVGSTICIDTDTLTNRKSLFIFVIVTGINFDLKNQTALITTWANIDLSSK